MQVPDDFLALHPFVRKVAADKIRGCMVGSALGDAVGLYTEFLSKEMSFAAYPNAEFNLVGNVTKFRNDSHRNKFHEGSWTDDTDHALLILLSYLHNDGKTTDSHDYAQRLRDWVEQGLRCLDRLPLGLGKTVGKVVLDENYASDPKTTAYRHWKNGKFAAAPNGSLMRTHPLGPMCVQLSMEETFQKAADFSCVTHPDPRCVVSCCIAVAILGSILRGDLQRETDLDELIDKASAWAIDWQQDSKRHERYQDGDVVKEPTLDQAELYRHVKAPDYTSLQLDDLVKQGYVYKCLGSAILTLRLSIRRTLPQPWYELSSPVESKQKLFRELITTLVMEGGDADTNATVAGAFVGCWLGMDALPSEWVQGMSNSGWLLRKCDALVQTIGVDECMPGYEGAKDLDTEIHGSKGALNKDQLEAREKALVERVMVKIQEGKKEEERRQAKQKSGGSWLGGVFKK